MTYLQAHAAFRSIRADWDRLDRLIKSPRVSTMLKPLLLIERDRISKGVELARAAAIALQD